MLIRKQPIHIRNWMKEVSNLHKRFFRFLLASDKSFEKRGTKDYCTCCANSLSFCKTLGGPVSYQSEQNSIIMIHFPSDWWPVCGWQRAKSFSSLKDDQGHQAMAAPALLYKDSCTFIFYQPNMLLSKKSQSQQHPLWAIWAVLCSSGQNFTENH